MSNWDLPPFHLKYMYQSQFLTKRNPSILKSSACQNSFKFPSRGIWPRFFSYPKTYNFICRTLKQEKYVAGRSCWFSFSATEVGCSDPIEWVCTRDQMQQSTTLLAEGDTTIRMGQLYSAQGFYRFTAEAKEEQGFKIGKQCYMFSKKGHITNLFDITEDDTIVERKQDYQWLKSTVIPEDSGFAKKVEEYLNSFTSRSFSGCVCKRVIYHKSLCLKSIQKYSFDKFKIQILRDTKTRYHSRMFLKLKACPVIDRTLDSTKHSTGKCQVSSQSRCVIPFLKFCERCSWSQTFCLTLKTEQYKICGRVQLAPLLILCSPMFPVLWHVCLRADSKEHFSSLWF